MQRTRMVFFLAAFALALAMTFVVLGRGQHVAATAPASSPTSPSATSTGGLQLVDWWWMRSVPIAPAIPFSHADQCRFAALHHRHCLRSHLPTPGLIAIPPLPAL
jgi:hypothetical protein